MSERALDFRLAVCPACEMQTPAMLTCVQCQGAGRLVEHRAKALRQAKYPGVSLKERQRIWKALGGETEITPRSRVWPRQMEDGSWDA